MDLLLIATPIYNNEEGIYPHLGLVSIATYLKEKYNFDVKILDLALDVYSNKIDVKSDFYEKIAEKIFETDVNIVGITCQNYNLSIAINIAKYAKHVNANLKIILGGPGVHGVEKELLRKFQSLDFIASGEGEVVLSQLLLTILSNKKCETSGLFYRGENNEIHYNGKPKLINELDTIPFPNFKNIINVTEYFILFDDERRALNVELARGCNGGCDFCGCFSFWGGRHRYFSLDYVVNNIKNLIIKYNINHIYLSDDNFMKNRDCVVEFCKKIIESKIEITWDTRARIDNLDINTLKLMKTAGCSEILIGVESADNEILLNMKKRIKSEQQYNAIKEILDADIFPILSLILGYPNESKRSIDQSLLLLVRLYMLNKPMVAYFHILSIVPGTKLYDNLKEYLCFDDINNVLSELSLGNSNILEEDRKLILEYPEIFSTFYYIKTANDIGILKFISKYSTTIIMRLPFTFKLLNSFGFSYVDLFEDFMKNNNDYTDIVIEFANRLFLKMKNYDIICEMLKFELKIYEFSIDSKKDKYIIRSKYNLYDIRKKLISEESIKDLLPCECIFLLRRENNAIKVLQSKTVR